MAAGDFDLQKHLKLCFPVHIITEFFRIKPSGVHFWLSQERETWIWCLKWRLHKELQKNHAHIGFQRPKQLKFQIVMIIEGSESKQGVLIIMKW